MRASLAKLSQPAPPSDSAPAGSPAPAAPRGGEDSAEGVPP